VGVDWGLATAYSIIKKHGGYIDVASKTNSGTTFTLYLPAAISRREAESCELKGNPGPGACTAKILVMDDEVAIRSIVSRMLTRCGYSVMTAADGREALALYGLAFESDSPFDAVIMDLTIPGGLGGKETIKDLLALDPAVRAIVSSGYADDPVMANYAQYGFKNILAKPCDLSQLKDVLAQVLQ
jgi:two-component system, cell cycle sensor histidine kinase and response regulator CckA